MNTMMTKDNFLNTIIDCNNLNYVEIAHNKLKNMNDSDVFLNKRVKLTMFNWDELISILSNIAFNDIVSQLNDSFDSLPIDFKETILKSGETKLTHEYHSIFPENSGSHLGYFRQQIFNENCGLISPSISTEQYASLSHMQFSENINKCLEIYYKTTLDNLYRNYKFKITLRKNIKK
jgi:hypothetical protein